MLVVGGGAGTLDGGRHLHYADAPGSNGPNSFLVSVDGGAPLKLGNNKDFYQQFHWDGEHSFIRWLITDR